MKRNSYFYKDYEFNIVDSNVIDKYNINIEDMKKITELSSYKDNYVYAINKLTNHIMILTKIRYKKITSFDMMKSYLSKMSQSPNEKIMFKFVNLNMELIKIKI